MTITSGYFIYFIDNATEELEPAQGEQEPQNTKVKWEQKLC